MAEDGEASAPESSISSTDLTELTTTDSTDSDVTCIDSRILEVTLETATDSTTEIELETTDRSSCSTCSCPEDSIIGDEYSSDLQDALDKATQLQVLQDYKDTPANGFKKKTYDELPFLKRNEEDKARHPPENLSIYDFILLPRLDWLHVKMPKLFNYTAAIVRSDVKIGLLHSVLRHFSDWEKHIPDFKTTFDSMRRENGSDRYNCFHADIHDIENYQGPTTALYDTDGLLTKMKKEIYDDPVNSTELKVFTKLQMLVYDFILNNTTDQHYRGETCNEKENVRILFNTKNRSGQHTVMFLAMNSFVYQNNENLPDERPFRFIRSVFFNPEEQERCDPTTKLFDPKLPSST